MAPKGAKRAATRQPEEEPNAKRMLDFVKEQGIDKSTYMAVTKIVEHPLAGLPEDVRKMLLAVVPWSLCVAADERVGVQAAVVRMLGEVVEDIQAKLHAAVEAERAGASTVETERAKLESSVERAEAALAEKKTGVSNCEDAEKQAKEHCSAKEKALADTQAEKQRNDAAHERALAEKAEFDILLTDTFKKLRDGEWEEKQGKELLETLKRATVKLDLDESLAASLPVSVMKKARGTFDELVVSQAEESIRAKIASLAAAAEALTGPIAERAATVTAARAELAAAAGAAGEAGNALGQAKQEAAGAKAAVEAARQALKMAEPELSKVTAALDKKKADLESFRDYHAQAFASLRDRVAEKGGA